MTRAELTEAIAVLGRIADLLLQYAGGDQGAPGADLRRACGDLAANADTAIRNRAAGAPMLACFIAAYRAGAAIDAFDRVRTALYAVPTRGWPSVALVQGAIRLTLSGMARRAAETPLTSRSELETYLARFNAAFGAAIDHAADENAQDSYHALSALYASVVQDLVRRGRTLPQVVPYAYGVRRPALWIANRLYADAKRSSELVLENHAVHPLFMPAHGRAFSV